VVDDKHDDEGPHGGPPGTEADPRHLVSELHEVTVKPATWNLGDTVIGSDRGLGEDAGEEETNHARDSVTGEDVEGVVKVEPDLESGEEVADAGGGKANEGRGRDTDEAGGRCNGDESSDGPGAEADDRPLVEVAPVQKHPGDAAEASREVSGSDGHARLEVGGEGGATVEAEPSEPEQDSAEKTCETECGAYWRRSVPQPLRRPR